MKVFIVTIFFFFFIGESLWAQDKIISSQIESVNKLSPLGKGAVILHGYLGQKMDSCILNGIMAKDFDLYVNPFKNHTDDPSGWQGEFWGKWYTSAALAYQYLPEKKFKTVLDSAAERMIRTQEKNGRLSSYKKDFGNWDLWGRKYALLGLVACYDQTGNKKALDCAVRSLDELIEITGPGKQKITETGLALLEALSSSSILEPIVLIYQRTGNPKYLEFAKYLVSLWSLPNKFTKKGMQLVEDAIAGIDPIKISSPKGYEQMSCYEGLCELYRATGDKKHLDAVVTFGHKVLEKEIMIVGSGSSGELWCNGAMRQTELLEQPMETCVTVTWMKLCYQLLRLTGDPIWADELEISLYNSLLGAMAADGNWWAYFSPLAGERMPSPMQVPICQSSCCVANGPRGFLTAPGWSVMKGQDGPVVNLYNTGKYKYQLANHNEVEIIQNTDYPKTAEIEIKISQKKAASYTLSLRIPSWSKNTKILVNDELVSYSGTGYAKIKREWKDGDKISLNLDMRGRVITSPGSVTQKAVMRGPIVLALDSRLVKEENTTYWLLDNDVKWNHDDFSNTDYVLLDSVSNDRKVKYIDLVPTENKPSSVWMAFEVPFLYRPTHFFKHKKQTFVMCDYSSAGNQYLEDNLFRVWLPQPMFMGGIFPRHTWEILDRGGKRAEIPVLKRIH